MAHWIKNVRKLGSLTFLIEYIKKKTLFVQHFRQRVFCKVPEVSALNLSRHCTVGNANFKLMYLHESNIEAEFTITWNVCYIPETRV